MTTPPSDLEAANLLIDIQNDCGGDIEVSHGKADDLLLDILKSLGYEQTVKQFELMPKWYA